MKVIVIRQPRASLIVEGFKDVENRSWATSYRGPLLIQASASLPSKRRLDEMRQVARRRGVVVPDELETGGIVGVVQLDDCVSKSRSKWSEGPVGWLLSKPKKLPFMPLKGQLGLFDPPARILKRLRSSSR